MWQTLNDRIARLSSGQPVTRDDVIWWALVIGLLFATVHLCTMLVTRWGDRKISFKSLVASILVHMTCGLGVVVMEPLPPVGSAEGTDDETDFIQEVSIKSDTDDIVDEEGNLPFWEQPQDSQTAPERIDAVDAEEPAKEEVVRDESEAAPDISIEPDLVAEAPKEAPDVEQTDDQQLTDTADTAIRVEDPLPFDSLVNTDARPRNRLDPLRPGAMTDTVEREDPLRGGIDRSAENLDIDSTLRNLDAPVDPEAELPQGIAAEEYDSRTGPAVAELPEDDAGGPAGDESGVAISSARLNPRMNRLNTRVRDSSPDGQATKASRDSRDGAPMIRPTPFSQPLTASSGATSIDGPRPNAIAAEATAPIARQKGTVAPIYQLRDLANRKKNALRYGGTEASEAAVEASLRWLARVQEPAGNWDASRYGSGRIKFDENNVDRMNAGIDADTGITALATLAFLGSGNTHEVGPYSSTVDRAINWLIDQQGTDGNFFGEATHFARMYCHGMTTYALAEAYGMQSDPAAYPRLRYALQRGINYIIQRQNSKDGAWRYRVGQQGDMSMFGWQLMALKSAEIAGLDIPQGVKDRMIDFLKSRSLGSSGGRAAYRPGDKVTAAMTAEALFCKQMLGIPREDPACREAVSFLLRYRPNRADYNLYYWYYGTLAMRHYGDVPWDVWNDTIQNLIVKDQVRTGPYAGSWNNTTKWGAYGGRIYSTALSTLCLEVYYRQLPLYKTSAAQTGQRN